MFRSVLTGLGLCAAALSLTACQVSKSSNPLSPTVAGPIPGVNITAPKPVDPTVGSRIAVDSQPLTLTVENASTSGVRPLSYLFEVATDSSFNNKVFTRDGITPGDGGRTAIKLPEALATGRTYYWRVRAQDGANTGSYSTPVSFNVFTPIVINAPALVSPATNATLTTLRPVYTWTNATHSGPVGALTYQIQLANTDSFASVVASASVPEGTSQTTVTQSADLLPATVYFWRVRAVDPTTAGPWARADSRRSTGNPIPIRRARSSSRARITRLSTGTPERRTRRTRNQPTSSRNDSTPTPAAHAATSTRSNRSGGTASRRRASSAGAATGESKTETASPPDAVPVDAALESHLARASIAPGSPARTMNVSTGHASSTSIVAPATP